METGVPDTLSRVYCDSITEFKVEFPKLVDAINLEPEHFQADDYIGPKNEIESNPIKYDHFRISNYRIYIRISSYMYIFPPLWWNT